MITEYFYWVLTSILGTQNFQDRGEDIGVEWELNTPELVKAKDPRMYALVTRPEYKLPTRAPDGKYRPKAQPTTEVLLFPR